MTLWWATVVTLALTSSTPWTVPCDTLWEWYTDESTGGAASCCTEDGGGPDDVRTVRPPAREYAVLVFSDKDRPLPWEATRPTQWDRENTTAVVTILDVADVLPFLDDAATYRDEENVPYLLVPSTPLIQFYVFPSRDAASFAPCHSPGDCFPHTAFDVQ
jgi:hypothetical protein